MTITANSFYIEHYIVLLFAATGKDASIPQFLTWGYRPFSTE